MLFLLRSLSFILFLSLNACSSLYYKGLEQIGIPKREIMVHRVEKARDTQEETKEQFKSTLAKFSEVSRFNGGDLDVIYTKLNAAYEKSVDQAKAVRKRIDDIKDVSSALFAEWEDEITQYHSTSLKHKSQQQLNATKQQYQKLIQSMERAASKLQPVLIVFKDQVMFLKHNLNARAISSLKNDLHRIESDVSTLIVAMEKSIDEANAFISTMENK